MERRTEVPEDERRTIVKKTAWGTSLEAAAQQIVRYPESTSIFLVNPPQKKKWSDAGSS